MSERHLKNCLTIRGDSFYCPLSLSLDTYWNCLNDCWHCYLRRLNHVWGKDLRPIEPENLCKQLANGLTNKNPRTHLAHALKNKKTIRFGNKVDPFQPVERQHRVSQAALQILRKFKWSVVIQTMCTEVMMDYFDLIVGMKPNVVVQPIISPGMEKDWEILERKRTTNIPDRLKHIKQFKTQELPIGVNGEPFIPGFHTEEEFEEALKRLKAEGINNYNTYNFHFNDFVAKRLHAIGVDIEKIWYYNQDAQWKPILQRLIVIAKKHNIILGCPDFVNSGMGFKEQVNTCCGIDVPNPTTFNAMTWKRRIQNGEEPYKVFEDSYDGIGDYEQGKAVFEGRAKAMYTLADAGITVISGKKKGLLI